MFSVLQRRKHWYKIKFPKKKSRHSPFWWILQSQISLHSKVVMKHMIHREGSFALFGQGWWEGMTGVCVCVVFPAIWNAIGSIFFCSILYPNSFFVFHLWQYPLSRVPLVFSFPSFPPLSRFHQFPKHTTAYSVEQKLSLLSSFYARLLASSFLLFFLFAPRFVTNHSQGILLLCHWIPS